MQFNYVPPFCCHAIMVFASFLAESHSCFFSSWRWKSTVNCRGLGRWGGRERQWLTDVYRGLAALLHEEGRGIFLCISLCSCFSSWPPCPLRGKCGECRSLLWRRNPNTRLPCQPPWPPTLSRWPGSISPGALGLVVPVWAPSHRPPHRFLPTSVCVLVLDCPSFTANGFLSAPRSSRLLSSYPRPDADRVKAVILENWVRRGENVYDVCEGERFRVSCPHHSTHEDSRPVTASNINMSSQSYKHHAHRE